MINAKERVKHLKGMVSNSHVPDRCYAPVADGESGNLKLAIGCVYCSHKRECWQILTTVKDYVLFEILQRT